MFRTFGKWLLTENGQLFSLGIATTATVGVFSVYAIPNSICLSYYLDVVRLYKKGITVQLSEVMLQRFDKAIELCKVPEKEKYLYKPFAVYGFEMFNAGTRYSKFGSIIGIPVNYSYNSIRDIDTSNIKVKGESVVWDLPEAIKLQESLILSEDAQIFGMCREIEMTRTASLLVQTSLGVVATFSTYALCTGWNKRFNMYTRSRGIRYTMYSLIGAFVAGNYFLGKDLSTCLYEESVDKRVRDLSPSLAKGGKEFYEKALAKNKAFRRLLGTEGESKFTVHGNFNYFLRTKHLPLVHRKSFFEPEETVGDASPLVQ